MKALTLVLALAAISPALGEDSPEWAVADLRAGIIGTDTSHVPAFTGLFHRHPEWRIKVVAAFKGGSPDLPVSADRLEKFATAIHDRYGVEMVDSIEALLQKVDVVLLESVDGRPHLAQARPVLKAGKRLFIDKPLAASLEDARQIASLSGETGTPFFSASAARFYPDVQRLRESPGVGKITKVQGSSGCGRLAFHPDLFYYGIHGVEVLYTVMGSGCESVTRTIDENADVTVGQWNDGRVGVFHGVLRGQRQPVLRIWGDEGVTETTELPGYDSLLLAMAEFFQTGRAPVNPAETIEVIEFMTAAQLSKERGGAQVRLEELRKRLKQ